MAFIAQPTDQTQQQGGTQSQIPTVPVIPSLQGTSGPSAGAGSGAQQGVTNTASPGAAPSSPWQNITTYLNANAGQAGNVAQSIAQNLQGQYDTANQGIQSTQQNFGQQIAAGTNPFNADVASRAAQSPGQFVQNPSDVASFQKMWGGAYGGPQSFSGSSDFSNLENTVQQAQKNAALVNQGTSGIQTLLQQTEGQAGRNPTPGITSLDALLLQEDPSNFATLSGAAAPFSNLTNFLSSTQQGLDTQAQQAAKEAAATGSQLQSQFLGPQGVVPTFQGTLNTGLQNASKQATAYNQQISDIVSKLNAGQPLTLQESYLVDPAGTLQTLNPYGQNNGVFGSMLAEGFTAPGVLAQFYNQPQQLAQPGVENVMTPQQLADAQALNQLVGQNAINTPTTLGKPFAVPSSSGSFQDQAALQELYNEMNALVPQLPYMTNEQISAFPNDINALASYLGLPSSYQGPPVQPLPPPVSGPPFLGPPGGGGDVHTGGFHTF